MAHPRLIDMRFEPGRRIIMISDIHGHLALFDRLLAKLEFNPEKDFLIVLGDVIEDGEACLGSLRRVMELEKAGCARMIAGNWDYYMHIWLTSDDPKDHAAFLRRTIELDNYNGSSLFADMCREIGIVLSPETDMTAALRAVRARFAEEIEYLGALPIVLDAGEFVCVHGGLDSIAHADIEAVPDSYLFLKNDAFADQGKSFERWVITGHWPVANYDRQIPRFSPHIFPDQKIAAIDGGCGKLQAAQLNALIVQAGDIGRFSWDYTDDFPRVRALEAQAASPDSIHTTWDTRFVDILSKDDELALVRHKATGRKMEVPLCRLWISNGADAIGGSTDHELPVEPGDILSVLTETRKGLSCKKGDIMGWYRGQYEKTEG